MPGLSNWFHGDEQRIQNVLLMKGPTFMVLSFDSISASCHIHIHSSVLWPVGAEKALEGTHGSSYLHYLAFAQKPRNLCLIFFRYLYQLRQKLELLVRLPLWEILPICLSQSPGTLSFGFRIMMDCICFISSSMGDKHWISFLYEHCSPLERLLKQLSSCQLCQCGEFQD